MVKRFFIKNLLLTILKTNPPPKYCVFTIPLTNSQATKQKKRRRRRLFLIQNNFSLLFHSTLNSLNARQMFLKNRKSFRSKSFYIWVLSIFCLVFKFAYVFFVIIHHHIYVRFIKLGTFFFF